MSDRTTDSEAETVETWVTEARRKVEEGTFGPHNLPNTKKDDDADDADDDHYGFKKSADREKGSKGSNARHGFESFGIDLDKLDILVENSTPERMQYLIKWLAEAEEVDRLLELSGASDEQRQQRLDEWLPVIMKEGWGKIAGAALGATGLGAWLTSKLKGTDEPAREAPQWELDGFNNADVQLWKKHCTSGGIDCDKLEKYGIEN